MVNPHATRLVDGLGAAGAVRWPITPVPRGASALRRLIAPVFAGAVLACTDDPVDPPIIEPPPPPELTKYSIVAAGSEHTCAVRSDGALLCWGSTRSGRLGDGRDTAGASLAPVAVEASLRFAQLEAGYNHTCGVAAGGRAYCWGIGTNGQLGNRSGASQLRPFFIDEPPRTFLQLSAGERHTCALSGDYRAYCWGWNSFGQVGNSSTFDQAAPVDVHTEERMYHIATGRDHTCALNATGRAFCWGRNNFGQLGNNAVAVRQVTVVPVSGGLTFTAITAGGEHTCALTPDGSAYCWGAGAAGQLGTGLPQSAAVPTRVAGELRFTSISAGEEHTCAVTEAGLGFCWGHNNYGRLGFESLPTVVPTPTRVNTQVLFTSVSAGRLHSCALARDGGVYCWGNGSFGQLGTGSLVAQPQPGRVSEPPAATAPQ